MAFLHAHQQSRTDDLRAVRLRHIEPGPEAAARPVENEENCPVPQPTSEKSQFALISSRWEGLPACGVGCPVEEHLGLACHIVSPKIVVIQPPDWKWKFCR